MTSNIAKGTTLCRAELLPALVGSKDNAFVESADTPAAQTARARATAGGPFTPVGQPYIIAPSQHGNMPRWVAVLVGRGSHAVHVPTEYFTTEQEVPPPQLGHV